VTFIEGYASRWWARDLNDDVVAAGAFRASLERTGPGGVKMLHGHEGRAPVGVWDEVREDAVGLFVRGRVLDVTPEGRMAAALVRAGAVDGLSIGFRAMKARAEERLRVLTEVELWEVSLVTFPMLPSARITAVEELRLAA
jgi:HK97 family phage prohead protease